MIEFTKGNLLEADVEAVVNTVNCVGVMGKGIALQFKQAFPENYREYEKACRANQVVTGKMFIVPTGSIFNPKYIINFPTKKHWKGKSSIEYVKSGLNDLIRQIDNLGIISIAVPPLGCGNGGLNWEDVRPIMIKAFEKIPAVKVLIYGPEGSPEPDKIIIGTERPSMTRARALFIMLMNNYALPGYRLTLLEIQKLAYFLQVMGEPLKLNYQKHFYGPYAENLNHVLQRLEGHFLRGYGDRSKDSEVYLLPKAADEAIEFLNTEPEAKDRLNKVNEIIMGYETPYGMELLSTVHWVVSHNQNIESNPGEVINAVYDWNARKRKMFREEHILIALEHLNKQGIFG
jgi:O-acetyl-ADP-ribose deacetylase (regulator of RNase III)